MNVFVLTIFALNYPKGVVNPTFDLEDTKVFCDLDHAFTWVNRKRAESSLKAIDQHNQSWEWPITISANESELERVVEGEYKKVVTR